MQEMHMVIPLIFIHLLLGHKLTPVRDVTLLAIYAEHDKIIRG